MKKTNDQTATSDAKNASPAEKNMSNEIDTRGDSGARARDLGSQEPSAASATGAAAAGSGAPSKAREIDRDTDSAVKTGVALGGGAVLGSILANID